METLLDLYPDVRLEPLLEHLSQGRAAAQALFELARKPGRQRFGALDVLRRMRAPGVEEMLRELSEDEDFETRLLARGLREIDVTDLAMEALADPNNRWRLWAARTLVTDAQHMPAARAVLVDASRTLEPSQRVSALEGLIPIDPGFAFRGLATLLAEASDAALRRRIVERLRADAHEDAQSALVTALGNADPDVVWRAAEALRPDKRVVLAVIDAALDGRLDVESAVELLSDARGWRPTAQAARLVISNNLPARRLGARLLSRIKDPEAAELATELIDDTDATVRCGAIWALVVAGTHDELLLARLGHLFGDEEPVFGPSVDDDVDDIGQLAWSVECCADAAYRLLKGRPALLEEAVVGWRGCDGLPGTPS